MAKVVAALVLALTLVGCSTTGTPTKGKPTVKNAGTPFRVYKTTIEGHPCYYTHAFIHGAEGTDTHVYSLDCDWSDR